MSIPASNIETPLDEQQILGFLRSNPDFFEQHMDLLTELKLPHPSGTAVSLIERQVTALRDQNDQLKSKLLNLIQVARDNDRLNSRMHSMIMDLVKARSITALLDTLSEHLHNEFNADAIAAHLTGMDEAQAKETGSKLLVISGKFKTQFAEILDTGNPICGRLTQAQLDTLFEDQAAALQSAAVIPIGVKAEQGLLAIGSREANRFFPGMGTHFLSHLGELVGQLLREIENTAD
ncbi:MAG: DUF484 family protein [Gammaproteobacteria bacterium]